MHEEELFIEATTTNPAKQKNQGEKLKFLKR
jgi:hypothetical protein